MPFVKLSASEKKFGARETRTVSVVVPVEEYETIKKTVKEYVNSYSKDKNKKIKIIDDNIKEIISMHLDIEDYIYKQLSITSDKYYNILYNHNKDLIDALIEKYPIERKIAIKTLTEEKIEKEKKLRNKIEHNPILSTNKIRPQEPVYRPPSISKHIIGSYEYNKEVDKKRKQANRRRK